MGTELYQAGPTLLDGGASADPYLIRTVKELALYICLVNYAGQGVYGELMGNINLLRASYVSVNPRDATVDNTGCAFCWKPIGWSSKMFQGVLDGDGHTVSNSKIIVLTGPGWSLPGGPGLFG